MNYFLITIDINFDVNLNYSGFASHVCVRRLNVTWRSQHATVKFASFHNQSPTLTLLS